MRRTLNEIYRLCQKSTEGAGAPPGLDMEAAKSAVWLLSRGLPALGDLARELALLHDEQACCFGHLPDSGELDAYHKAGTLIAPLLVDQLVGAAGGGSCALAVRGLSSPLYLLPSAAGYARGGLGFDYVLRSPDGEHFHFMVRDENDVTIEAPADTGISALCGGIRFDVEARCSRADLSVTATRSTGAALLVDAEALLRARSESVKHGVEVDQEAWSRLTEYAVKVLVPATHTSRRGAGALSSDNE